MIRFSQILAYSCFLNLFVLSLSAQKIMLIPLETSMIINDSETEMMKDNKVKISDIRFKFQQAINDNIEAQIIDGKGLQTHSLMNDTSKEAHLDLQNIYANISYQKADNPDILNKKKKPLYLKLKESINKKLDDDTANTEEVGVIKDEPSPIYIHANIRNKKVLETMGSKYATDYFVFINQLELKTQFKSCLDRTIHLFERDYELHYSVYDATGKQVSGGVSSIHVNKSSNDLNDIIQKYIPKLVDNVKMGLNGAKPINGAQSGLQP